MNKTLHSEEYRALTAWLKAQREAQGLTMRELADRLDTPHSFIGKVEQCERKLDIIEFVSYCKALGLQPSEGLKIIS